MSAGNESSSSTTGEFEQEAASSSHLDPNKKVGLSPPPFAERERGEQTAPGISAGSGFEAPTTLSGPTMLTPPSLFIPPPSEPSFSGQASTVRKRPRMSLIVFMVLLLLVLVSVGSSTFFLLTRRSPTPEVSTSHSVGQAFFVSSGQVSINGNQGVNDELEINLRHIPAPAPGTSYYAWLLQDTNQPTGVPLLLGKLQVKNGSVNFLYPGNAQHSNLLASTSRVLITIGDMNIVPINPLTDSSAWRYIAVLPQTPDPNDTIHHFSILDHLRDLLADDPTLASIGKHGGLSIWLQRSTGKILEWSVSARDYWDSHALSLMRRHFIRILDYLDGQANVQVDVPVGTPLVVAAPVALIGTDTSLPSDYLDQISGHLGSIVQAPGVTLNMRRLVVRIRSEMGDVRTELEQVRSDAKQLLRMSDAQLLAQSSLLLLDDMMTQAFYAYDGQVDPASGQLQAGVLQISDEIERLATLDMSPYNP